MRAARGLAMRTLLIDNYDSYTFNLFHLLGEVNGEEPIVVRNDELPWDDLAALRPDNIVISPGPGRPEHPRDAGVSLEVLRRADVPVLGVCLGHQDLAYVCGGTIEHAPEVMHGRLSRIHHDESTLFAGIPQDFLAVRYHSLVVGVVPPELRVTAWTPDGVVMALEHRTRPLFGVQFHPESVSTRHGRALRRELPRRDPEARPGRPRATATGRRAQARLPAAARHRRARAPRRRGLVRAGGRLRRPVRRPRPRGLARQLPQRGRRRAVLVHRRARRAARPGRPATTSPREPSPWSARPGARSTPRASSTTAAASSSACAPTRPSCRSTSSAGSRATSATSSRPSAATASRRPRRSPTPRSCCATGSSPSTIASAGSIWSR